MCIIAALTVHLVHTQCACTHVLYLVSVCVCVATLVACLQIIYMKYKAFVCSQRKFVIARMCTRCRVLIAWRSQASHLYFGMEFEVADNCHSCVVFVLALFNEL